MKKCIDIINKLVLKNDASDDELLYLVKNFNNEVLEKVSNEAVILRNKVYGNRVFIRGLIEIGNICKNDCFYCGIRRSNKDVRRYHLSKEEILSCCENGRKYGFSTFVLQGGEIDNDDEMIEIVSEIKRLYPSCAVTLSLGEKTEEIYSLYKNAGADRYLLRHESADSCHYKKLHPNNLTLENRLKCLKILKNLGFQTGCGFMVGSPYQTKENIISDLRFIKNFSPHMVGIGPFIPHEKTPFRDFPEGDRNLVLLLLSVIRLMNPYVLLPSTTALSSIDPSGRIKGLKAGANVVMPNLSPQKNRKDYSLYNNKSSFGAESLEGIKKLIKEIEKADCSADFSRGDCKMKL